MFLYKHLLSHVFLGLVVFLSGTLFVQRWWVDIGLIEVTRGMLLENTSILQKGQAVLLNRAHIKENDCHYYLTQVKLEQDNLVDNGGFELGTYKWNLDGPNQVLRVLTKGKYHSGFQSLMIQFNGVPAKLYQTSQKIVVKPATCYRLEAYVATKEMTDGVGLEAWDAERGYQYWYSGVTNLINGSTEWTKVSRNFCTAEDVQSIQVRIRHYGENGQVVSGTAWIDDVSLRIAPKE